MSPRKVNKKVIKSNIDETKKTFVFLLKDDLHEHNSQSLEIVHLQHPGTGQASMYLFSNNNTVQEIMTFSEENRSWFIDNTVLSDGKLFLSTPIDPIFLVLPYLKKNCMNYAMPLHQAIVDEDFPDNKKLLSCSGLDFLHLVADKKGANEMNAYKYNEEKTLLWLKKKAEIVEQILKVKNIHVNTGAISATFVKSDILSDTKDASNYLSFSHGIISEYIPEEISIKLSKYLGIREETNKRKSGPTPQKNETKKIKTDIVENTNNVFTDIMIEAESAPKVLSTKEKALTKAAVGTKTISSFFKKK